MGHLYLIQYFCNSCNLALLIVGIYEASCPTHSCVTLHVRFQDIE